MGTTLPDEDTHSRKGCRLSKHAVLNDLHIPYEDKKVVRLVVGFLKDLKPDSIIVAGDLCDFYAVSSFDKDPLLPRTLERDIRQVRTFLTTLKGISENVTWLGGNHEDRLRRFLWRHAEAFSPLGRHFERALRELCLPSVFGLDDLAVEYLPYGDGVTRGKLYITHGSKIRKHSGYSAKAEFEAAGTSILTGHTHRLGMHYTTNLAGPHLAAENGCLCSLQPPYTPHPNWQHGFSVVHVDSGGMFHVQQIPIIKRRMFWYGSQRISR